MEARVLGAVLRAESKVQSRFSTALPQHVTAWHGCLSLGGPCFRL